MGQEVQRIQRPLLQVDEGAAAASAIIQLLNRIIIEAEKLGGSDIHIEPGKDRGPGIVRVRVDALCREILKVPPEPTASLIARIKVMSRLDIAERRLPQDGIMKILKGFSDYAQLLRIISE